MFIYFERKKTNDDEKKEVESAEAGTRYLWPQTQLDKTDQQE